MPLVDSPPKTCEKCGSPNLYPEEHDGTGATRIETYACLLCGARYYVGEALVRPSDQRRRQPSHGKTRL